MSRNLLHPVANALVHVSRWIPSSRIEGVCTLRLGWGQGVSRAPAPPRLADRTGDITTPPDIGKFRLRCIYSVLQIYMYDCVYIYIDTIICIFAARTSERFANGIEANSIRASSMNIDRGAEARTDGCTPAGEVQYYLGTFFSSISAGR